MKFRFAVTLTALGVSTTLLPASTIIPVYSAATVTTINFAGTTINRSDVTNPSGVLTDNAAVIGYGAVGRNGSITSAARTSWQVGAFKVSDVLAAIGSSSLASLAGYTFTYSGVTEASATDIPDTSVYRAAYLGQWQGSTVAANFDDVPLRGLTSNANLQNMGDTTSGAADSNRTLMGTAIETLSGFSAAHPSQQTIGLNVVDLASTAQTLDASGFDLSGLATELAADSDLTDNYVFFSFYLDPKLAAGTPLYTQVFTDVTLTAIPEPRAALLGGLGVLGLLRRRRA